MARRNYLLSTISLLLVLAWSVPATAKQDFYALSLDDLLNVVGLSIIGLFSENNKLRLDINLAAARQNNLVMSSNLLKLARTMKQ